jgi:hypothetical protein
MPLAPHIGDGRAYPAGSPVSLEQSDRLELERLGEHRREDHGARREEQRCEREIPELRKRSVDVAVRGPQASNEKCGEHEDSGRKPRANTELVENLRSEFRQRLSGRRRYGVRAGLSPLRVRLRGTVRHEP